MLLHSFNNLEKGNIGVAWKGYLESVYVYNDLGKDLPPEGYVLASSLCIAALKKGNEKVPCRLFRYGDSESTTVTEHNQTLDESISYLERANVSGAFDKLSIKKLSHCYQTSDHDQLDDCTTLGIELIFPYFQLTGK